MRKEQVEIKKLGINGEGIGYINKRYVLFKMLYLVNGRSRDYRR